MRSCYGWKASYLALATFALAASVSPLLKRFKHLTGGVQGISLPSARTPQAFQHVFPNETWFYYLTWGIAAVLFAIAYVGLHGRVGRSLRAVRDSEIAAIAFGVNPVFYKALAFGWSAAYAGVAGALLAVVTAYVSPDIYGIALSLTLLAGAVMGGLDLDVGRRDRRHRDPVLAALGAARQPRTFFGRLRHRGDCDHDVHADWNRGCAHADQGGTLVNGASLLSAQNLTIRFGGIAALADVSFDVVPGQITGLIGPNGAGKTTCFNCITRLYQPVSGTITFNGEDISRVPAHKVLERGIARTFQNLELFGSMSVLDNVQVGARGGARQALEMLDYVGLADVADRPVRSLSFGARKNVELARALASKPQLLLLDEPAAGFGFEEIEVLRETIKRLRRDFNTTILMVEHQMQLVMGICDRIIVLCSGKKLADGDPGRNREQP